MRKANGSLPRLQGKISKLHCCLRGYFQRESCEKQAPFFLPLLRHQVGFGFAIQWPWRPKHGLRGGLQGLSNRTSAPSRCKCPRRKSADSIRRKSHRSKRATSSCKMPAWHPTGWPNLAAMRLRHAALAYHASMAAIAGWCRFKPLVPAAEPKMGRACLGLQPL